MLYNIFEEISEKLLFEWYFMNVFFLNFQYFESYSKKTTQKMGKNSKMNGKQAFNIVQFVICHF